MFSPVTAGRCLALGFWCPWGRVERRCPRLPAAAAEKQGWDYEVAEYHNPTTQRPKRYVGYGDK